ncbi:hypothetical protein D3C73_1641520 [compost metagenome]
MPLPTLNMNCWKPRPATGAKVRLASFFTWGASDGFRRSSMSRSPARRFDKRTVVSGMGRNVTCLKA